MRVTLGVSLLPLARTNCDDIRTAFPVETIEKKDTSSWESNLVVCPLAFNCPLSYPRIRSVHVTLHWFRGAQTSLLMKFLGICAIHNFVTGS